ncbi:hypothetical protein MTO96_030318 [Rhipicephalus appendiculatus]
MHEQALKAAIRLKRFRVTKTTSNYGSDASASNQCYFVEDIVCDIHIQYKPRLSSTELVLQDLYVQAINVESREVSESGCARHEDSKYCDACGSDMIVTCTEWQNMPVRSRHSFEMTQVWRPKGGERWQSLIRTTHHLQLPHSALPCNLTTAMFERHRSSVSMGFCFHKIANTNKVCTSKALRPQHYNSDLYA